MQMTTSPETSGELQPLSAGAEIIDKYFPHLSERQREQFRQMGALYAEWNAQINVISRKDIDNLYPHHVLHSLGIARILNFRAGTTVLDLGTGGGFPGIPLAALYPEVSFLLVDSIGKKVKVATAVAEALELDNVRTTHCRAESIGEKYDFVVSRAVMKLSELAKISSKLIRHDSQQNALPNGLICLKGGELQHEVLPFRHKAMVEDLWPAFEEDYFKTKKVVYIPL